MDTIFQGTKDLDRPIDIDKASALYIVGWEIRLAFFILQFWDLGGCRRSGLAEKQVQRLQEHWRSEWVVMDEGTQVLANGGGDPATYHYTGTKQHVNRGNMVQKMPHAEKRIDTPSVPSSNTSA